MKAFIDSLLNRITMYRAALYYLCALVAGAIVLSAVGVMPYNPIDIVGATALLVAFSFLFNWFFVVLFRAKQNPESRFITALILALIIGPLSIEQGGALLLFVAAFVAMGAKYVLAYKKVHVFNPAAAGALAVALIFGQGSSWWVGTSQLAPIILIGGLLLAYKIQRLGLVAAFMTALISFTVVRQGSLDAIAQLFAHPQVFIPALFFAFVMLVEPLTSPQNRNVRYYYAVLVAALIVIYGFLDLTAPYALELALLSGNVFSRVFSFDPRVVLTLRKKKEEANNTQSFWFEPSRAVSFVPGQFMQWELPHRNADSRGTRRFFTIGSSPTESQIMLTTKFADPSSTFKTALREMKEGDQLSALNVTGEFVLSEKDKRPCVFIAGGIGVTPFRSMIKHMLDKDQPRPVTLLYSNKTVEDIAFRSLFDEAVAEGWLKTVYTITETAPYEWKGRIGYITADMIKEEVPQYLESVFYISGPQPMVAAFKKMLGEMGIASDSIKTDFFPGYSETHQPIV